eukprot:gene2558-biopygen979
MRIQQDLVWDKHTGDLIGFVDLGDKELNVATLEGTDALANHVLVLMVVAETCDGASSNRKLFKMHKLLEPKEPKKADVTYKVLSSSVAKVLFAYGPPEAAGTAKFCSMMDQFFDCTNVRNKREHPLKQKAFLKPYTTTDDIRFDWLINSFLVYFVEWKKSIQERKGSFNDKERASMFISSQTFEGLKITCHSLVECTQYLLCNGVDYVLSERFSQDALENYFGQQRSLGRRKDNPTLKDFGYNDNSIRNQLAVTPIAGNVGGVKYGQIANLNKIDETPVPSRQTKRFKEA